MLLTKYYIYFFLFWIKTVICERTKDKMYSAVQGASCFRRLNGTHSTGCSSSFSGSTGVLHVIKSKTDFDFVLNSPPSPPYAVVVPAELFQRGPIMQLKDSLHVSAIVLIDSNNTYHFSQELNCPNPSSGLPKQSCDSSSPKDTWNPYGTGLLHENFPFPIYYPDILEQKKIVDCFEKFNNFALTTQNQRSLCSIEINTFMTAAVNSEVCLRRTNYQHYLTRTKYCDPLSSQNIYATLFQRDRVDPSDRIVNKEEKFILVSARMDTTSMFDGLGTGAMDSLVSYAALLSTAHMLTTLLPEKNISNNLNILFMLFNGESYDYIGSQRFVYDIKKGEFPSKSLPRNAISLESIELMIDIGVLDELSSIHLYHATEFEQVSHFKSLIDKYNEKYTLNITTISKLTQNLPPTSAQSFLRENITFPSITLYSKPTNRFYHSIYDHEHNIGFTYHNTSLDFTILQNLTEKTDFLPDSIQIAIRNISSALAMTLYELVTNTSYDGDEGTSPILVDELLYCFLISANCTLLHAAEPPNSPPIFPFPLIRYVSVPGSYSHDSVGWTYRLFGYLLGHKIDTPQTNCTPSPLLWYSGINGTGECFITTQEFSDAISPAFIEEDYDWSSGKYSTWTESTWKVLNARIYLKPSSTHEALNLAVGFVVMMLSFVIIFLINSRSDVLFGEDVSAVPEFVPPTQC